MATTLRFFGGYWRTTNVTRSTIEAQTAFTAPRDLSARDDHDDVDRAPDNGRGALPRHAPAYRMADIGGGRPAILSGIRNMHHFAARQVRSVLFHMGANSSSAGRPAPFRLGYRTCLLYTSPS